MLNSSYNEILKKFQANEKDSGSTSVQIIFITERINELNEHLLTHKKDHSGRRGLVMLVNQRKRLILYLQKENYAQYKELIKDLGLRK